MNRNVIRMAAHGLLAGSLMIHAFLFWKERSEVGKGYPDFASLYTAGLILGQGQRHQLYDQSLQFQLQRRFAPDVKIRQGPLPYNHPPFEALIFFPLAKLNYLQAYIAWDILNLAMLAAVPIVLRRHIPILQYKSPLFWFLALLAFFPVFITLLHGQDSVLLLLLFALAFAALARKSDFVSGCWLALGSIKVQFVVPLVLILWAWKRHRVVAGFLLTLLGLGAISIAVVGLPATLQYPGYVLHVEQMRARGAIIPEGMPNLRGLMEGWLAAGSSLPLLTKVVVVLSFALLLYVIMAGRDGSGRSSLRFGLAVVGAVLLSYHAFASDLALLTIPLLITFDYALQSGFQLRRDLRLLLPAGLLLLTPLYMLFWFQLGHLNLVAVILLFWLWGTGSLLGRTPQEHR